MDIFDGYKFEFQKKKKKNYRTIQNQSINQSNKIKVKTQNIK